MVDIESFRSSLSRVCLIGVIVGHRLTMTILEMKLKDTHVFHFGGKVRMRLIFCRIVRLLDCSTLFVR